MKIETFQQRHIRDVFHHFYPDSNEQFVEEFLNDSSVISYVVTHNDMVIGLIYGYLLKRINSIPMLYIHSVDVIKGYQGKGVGTLMMKKMLELKEQSNVLKVFLITNKSNEKAMHLYRKVGGDIPYDDDVVFEYK